MKHFFGRMLIALTLVAALVAGVATLAENAEPELPAQEQAQPEQAQPEPEPAQPEQTQPEQPEQSSEDAALQDALDAYRSAKESERWEALEAELKAYVEAGKLTQAQAELILDHYKAQQSLREGACPNCGCQLRNDRGMGRGGRGMSGGMNGRMNGGRGMFDRQSTFGGQSDFGGQSTLDRQSTFDRADGAQAAPGMPGMNGPDGF